MSNVIYDFQLSGQSDIAWNGTLLIQEEEGNCTIYYTGGGSNDAEHESAITKERAQQLIQAHENAKTDVERKNTELIAMEIAVGR